MVKPPARDSLKVWLIVLVSLADEAAVAFLIFLLLWWLNIPITIPVIVFLVLFFIGFSLLMHKAIIPTLRRPRVSGGEGMVGLEGEVIEPLNPYGMVKVKGEYWKAFSTTGEVPPGQKVEIIAVEHLVLRVREKG